jgi:DNA-binding NarL/FixJ family response regulator
MTILPPGGEAGSPVRVLIVEDHPGLRLVLRTLLESDERLVVLDAVDSGAAACAYPLTDDVDVALVDIGLPDIGGLEVTRRLRGQNPDLRVVVMSGSGHDRTAGDALAAGAAAYLQKGALHDDLIRSILAARSPSCVARGTRP